MKKFIQNNMEYVVLIVFILWGLIMIPAVCKAAEPVDTVAFNNAKIEKIISDKYVTAKGKSTIKYYILTTDKVLVPISKTVYEKIQLCGQYGAYCALDAVVSKKTRKIKRIILG